MDLPSGSERTTETLARPCVHPSALEVRYVGLSTRRTRARKAARMFRAAFVSRSWKRLEHELLVQHLRVGESE